MKKGFTILEVIIAITIITVGASAALMLITITIGQMGIPSSQFIAAYLAQEGIEIVRNIRDTNWLEQTSPSSPDNPWDEGLNTSCQNGCEVDYTYTTFSDPVLPPYGNDGRFLCIDTNGFYKYIDPCIAPNIQSIFKRKITITAPATDTLAVIVSVEWEEKGRKYSQIAQENLYNWR